MNRSRLTLLVGSCMAAPLALAFAMPAQAQSATTTSTATATATAPDARGDTTVDEVQVTAERRVTSVREVGFSIAAVGGEQVRAQEIHGPAGIVQLVPGITLNNSDKSITVVEIRGAVSTFRTATLDAPIGFFVDDIYYPYSTDLNSNFYDINHVEVLRGPQGTLFGRNVTGGAIVLQSNNPTFDEDYLMSVSGGNAGYIRTEGMLNGSLVDGKLAGRVAFSTERSDGLIKAPNQVDHGNFGRGESGSARAKLLFTPSSDLSILLSADYNKYTGVGASGQLLATTTTGAAPTIPASFTNASGTFYQDKWTTSDSIRAPNSLLQRGVDAHVNWDVGGGTVTSITAYRGTKTTSYLNNIQSPGPGALIFDSNVDNKWFTQEVRFASAPGRLSYVVGAYYLHGDYHTINNLTHQPQPGSALVGLYAILPFTAKRDQKGIVTSYALFGEGTFKFTDQLSLSVGARYTDDKKDLDYHASSPTNDPTATPQGPVAGYLGPIHVLTGKSWNAVTPRVTLKYVPNDHINTYLTYSKGFKSGGFVDASYTVAGASLPLAPEHATNIEAGIKTRFLDNRLSANIAVFEQKTVNLQNFSGAGGIPHSYNGTSRVRGVELETNFHVTSVFTLAFNYAYLDARFLQLVDPATPLVSYAGNPLKYTPKNSFNVSARYDFPLSNDAKLTAQADYAYSDRTSTADNNSTKLYPTLYDNTEGSTLNGRLTYVSGDGRWSLSGWGKNLTDHYQISYADDVTPFVTTAAGTHFWRVISNNPRTFGVTLTFRK